MPVGVVRCDGSSDVNIVADDGSDMTTCSSGGRPAEPLGKPTTIRMCNGVSSELPFILAPFPTTIRESQISLLLDMSSTDETAR